MLRRDIADIFALMLTVLGEKSLDWNLVDYIAPPSKFSDLINERVAETSKTVKCRNGTKGIKLNSLKEKFLKIVSSMKLYHVILIEIIEQQK